MQYPINKKINIIKCPSIIRIALIPFKYGYIIKTLWLTAFYAPLVPIVVPVSIFGLIINYWL